MGSVVIGAVVVVACRVGLVVDVSRGSGLVVLVAVVPLVVGAVCVPLPGCRSSLRSADAAQMMKEWGHLVGSEGRQAQLLHSGAAQAGEIHGDGGGGGSEGPEIPSALPWQPAGAFNAPAQAVQGTGSGSPLPLEQWAAAAAINTAASST